jgi:hypothetical protein
MLIFFYLFIQPSFSAKMVFKTILVIFLVILSIQAFMDIRRVNSSTTINEEFGDLEQTLSDDKKMLYSYFKWKKTLPNFYVDLKKINLNLEKRFNFPFLTSQLSGACHSLRVPSQNGAHQRLHRPVLSGQFQEHLLPLPRALSREKYGPKAKMPRHRNRSHDRRPERQSRRGFCLHSAILEDHEGFARERHDNFVFRIRWQARGLGATM